MLRKAIADALVRVIRDKLGAIGEKVEVLAKKLEAAKTDDTTTTFQVMWDAFMKKKRPQPRQSKREFFRLIRACNFLLKQMIWMQCYG